MRDRGQLYTKDLLNSHIIQGHALEIGPGPGIHGGEVRQRTDALLLRRPGRMKKLGLAPLPAVQHAIPEVAMPVAAVTPGFFQAGPYIYMAGGWDDATAPGSNLAASFHNR